LTGYLTSSNLYGDGDQSQIEISSTGEAPVYARPLNTIFAHLRQAEREQTVRSYKIRHKVRARAREREQMV
jgi:hypothetical protein